jgi:K+-sensing histidine kinase KdpD
MFITTTEYWAVNFNVFVDDIRYELGNTTLVCERQAPPTRCGDVETAIFSRGLFMVKIDSNRSTKTDQDEPSILGPAASNVTRYLAAFLLNIFATAIAVGADMQVAIPNLSLIFVVPVVVSGAILGLGPSLFSALLGALSFDFFLAAPRYSLVIDDAANIWAMGLLLLVGLIVSTVSFTSQRRAEQAARLKRQFATLDQYGREVSAEGNLDAIASVTNRSLASLSGLPTVVLIVANEKIVAIQSSGVLEPNKSEIEAARSSLTTGDIVHGGIYPNVDSRFDFWPIRTQRGPSAILGVALDDDRSAEAEVPVAIMARVLAAALDREELSLSSRRELP